MSYDPSSLTIASSDYVTFESMGLKDELLKGLKEYGIEKPSKIQQQCIVKIVNSERDLIICSKAGSGKTIAILISAIQYLDVNLNSPQILILLPNRELATCTKTAFTQIINDDDNNNNLKAYTCIGGRSIKNDIEIIKNGIHCLFSTPGRLLDMIYRGVLNTKQIKMIILDEADEAFSRGFKDHLFDIVSIIKQNNFENKGIYDKSFRLILSSSTICKDMKLFIAEEMKDPEIVSLIPQDQSINLIDQFYVNIGNEQYKFETLIDLLNSILGGDRVIIYCNNKANIDQLSTLLKDHYNNNENIEIFRVNRGNMTNFEIVTALKSFTCSSSIKNNYLVTTSTDLLSNYKEDSYFFESLSYIINYDLPSIIENYEKRIGHRKSTSSKKCIAINIITNDQIGTLNNIQQYYRINISELPADLEPLLKK